MKIFTDENLPRKLAACLSGYECRTVVQCGWSGKQTLDKNPPYQQNLNTKRIAVLIVRARSNRIQDLLPIIPECLAALAHIQPRQVVRLG